MWCDRKINDISECAIFSKRTYSVKITASGVEYNFIIHSAATVNNETDSLVGVENNDEYTERFGFLTPLAYVRERTTPDTECVNKIKTVFDESNSFLNKIWNIYVKEAFFDERIDIVDSFLDFRYRIPDYAHNSRPNDPRIVAIAGLIGDKEYAVDDFKKVFCLDEASGGTLGYVGYLKEDKGRMFFPWDIPHNEEIMWMEPIDRSLPTVEIQTIASTEDIAERIQTEIVTLRQKLNPIKSEEIRNLFDEIGDLIEDLQKNIAIQELEKHTRQKYYRESQKDQMIDSMDIVNGALTNIHNNIASANSKVEDIRSDVDAIRRRY